jgi:hypothetical protein
VAATVAASTTSLTASPTVPTTECVFFFAMFPTSHVPKYCVTSDPARSDGARFIIGPMDSVFCNRGQLG